MSLVEHLQELRTRLAISLVALALGVVVVFVLWEPVFTFLRQPYCATAQGRESCRLVTIGVFDQFQVRLHVAFLGGILLSAPVWLYEIGAFITPALHRKERRYAFGFLSASLLLFAVGTVFAYLTISKGLEFLLSVGGGGVTVLLSISSYLSFVTLTLVAFGLAFEFPVIVLFLNLVGVFPLSMMRAWRRGMIVALSVASAVITPSTDPFSFLFMFVPLVGLYEVCILGARLRERRRSLGGPDLDPSWADDAPSPLDPGPGT